MNTDSEKFVQLNLQKMEDEGYRRFLCNIIPNINKSKIIGVRIPALRSFVKSFAKDKVRMLDFLDSLPHEYHDENNVHALLIEKFRSYDKVMLELEKFLPYVDNWETCDLINPPALSKNMDKLIDKVIQWLSSDKLYTVRFGIRMLMVYYLGDEFKPEYLEMVANISFDEYYVNMARAWFFAEALAKQYESALPYLENDKLDLWTLNKTIQKAMDSSRISSQRKIYLRKLRKMYKK